MKYIIFIGALALLFFNGCDRDKKITDLLSSNETEDVILGAYKAGESGDKKFVSLLLRDANDQGTSTNTKFKGITVYQAKMIALKKIFKEEPPVKITYKNDSTVIRFYRKLANLE
jgi:hypothetical protein